LFVQEASSLIAFAELSTRHDIKELAGRKLDMSKGSTWFQLFGIEEWRASCFLPLAGGLDRTAARH
jgi:hypothetical protein